MGLQAVSSNSKGTSALLCLSPSQKSKVCLDYSCLPRTAVRACSLQGAVRSPNPAGEDVSGKVLPSPEATQRLIKSRRSCFPKDYTGESFDRYPPLLCKSHVLYSQAFTYEHWLLPHLGTCMSIRRIDDNSGWLCKGLGMTTFSDVLAYLSQAPVNLRHSLPGCAMPWRARCLRAGQS